MSPSILIQAGHSAAYPPHLPGGGGAAGEADWTAQLAARIADYLKASPTPTPPDTSASAIVGSWAYYTPPITPGTPPILHIASPPHAVTSQDYTLFISLHYNGSTSPNTSGCNAGRALNDPAHAQADEFIDIWRTLYPTITGIPLDPTVPTSPNVQYYYAFIDTSPSTPGVLIEHGYGAPGQGDHDILYNNIDLIAQADVRAICAFLKIDPPTFLPSPTPPTTDPAPPVQPQPPSPQPPTSDLSVYAEALRLANWQKHEMEAYIRDYPPGHRASVDDAATQEGNPPIALMLRWAQDHFDAGETAP